jgi:gamma-glutamylcyclotransferase
MTIYNLAYGSNMSLNRILARLPNAERIGVASVTGFRLTFDKKGFDNSAKCNALYTGEANDVLFGVLYAINAVEKQILDNIEGPRYDNQSIIATGLCGTQYSAYCYVANTLDNALLPFDWYVKHVLTGAQEAQLPDYYLAQIEQQAVISDSDLARAAKEFSIYK